MRVAAIPGQIVLGALSDRIGREWVWTIGCAGFALCYAALIALEHAPSVVLLYTMVLSQGLLGYAVASVMGPIVIEIFEGPHFGSIFGAIFVTLLPIVIRYTMEAFSGVFFSQATMLNLIPALRLTVFGFLIIVFLVVEPEGLNRLWRNIRSYFRVWPFAY